MDIKYLYRVRLLLTGQLLKERLRIVYSNKTYAYLKVPGKDLLDYVSWDRVKTDDEDVKFEGSMFLKSFYFDHEPKHIQDFDYREYRKKIQEMKDELLSKRSELRLRKFTLHDDRFDTNVEIFKVEDKIHVLESELRCIEANDTLN